jgi:tetratricopeptide (TPR) repeat protein
MGHTQSTVVAVRVLVRPKEDGGAAKTEAVATAVAVAASSTLGAMSFDACLYEHLARMVEQKFHVAIAPGSKRGLRLLKACERLRKLLSQLAEAQVSIENVTDNGDINFSLKREELAALCSRPVQEFKDLLRSVAPAGEAVVGVEVLGGGVRMHIVQAAITEVLGEVSRVCNVTMLHALIMYDDWTQKPFGAKLDDSSVALGAALVASQRRAASSIPNAAAEGPVSQSTLFCSYDVSKILDSSKCLSVASIEDAIHREQRMLARDAEVRAIYAERNAMEALLYECKNALNSKHAGLIDSNLLNRRLDEFEQWMWDQASADDVGLALLEEKHKAFKEGVSVILEMYTSAVANEKHQLERQLERDAQLAEEERQQQREGDGEEEDHDTRKLKKADRMRLVVKNKDEGNELFKGGNFRPAAARYHKALTHIAKFFDLSPEDQVEVAALKLSLYLNLSQCYIKLENWDNALRNVEDALAIDSNNSKAIFRRATVLEAKKDYEKALKDFKRAEELTPQDKLICKAVERVSKLVQKEREKEKKMWGRAFGAGDSSTA